MPRVKHVVLLRFKPEATPHVLAELFSAVAALRHTIPGLLDVSWGANNSPEGQAKGFTHGFVMTFADVASRDGYLPHPTHETVKSMLLQWVDGPSGVIVVDWEE